jgi:hypothetical protein
MENFFDYLNDAHNKAIEHIKYMIDVDAQEYPEYKEAATLCKFFFDYEGKYSLLHYPEKYGSFYDCAQDLENLFDTIYHALTDDGDIAFIQLNKHTPKIIFENRWELTLENLLTKEERLSVQRLNEFKAKYNLSPTEHSLDFFSNVCEYIEAVKAYDIEVEENHKKAKEIIKNMKNEILFIQHF